MKKGYKSFAEKYKECLSRSIVLSEDNIKYEVNLTAIIQSMDKKFAGYEENDRDTKFKKLFDDMADYFKEKERKAEKCGTRRSFDDGYFGPAIKKPEPSIEEQKKCIHIIKDLESFFDKEFLIEQEEGIRRRNQYINSLVLPLISYIVNTDFFSYIPYCKEGSMANSCYRNQLKMIYENIDILFSSEYCEWKSLWHELLKPLEAMICDGDFPGVVPGIILEANYKLKYFDCVYKIAEDFSRYEIMRSKKMIRIDLGESVKEVNKERIERKSFYKENGIIIDGQIDEIKELQVFYKEFEDAYRTILKEKMKIDL